MALAAQDAATTTTTAQSAILITANFRISILRSEKLTPYDSKQLIDAPSFSFFGGTCLLSTEGAF